MKTQILTVLTLALTTCFAKADLQPAIPGTGACNIAISSGSPGSYDKVIAVLPLGKEDGSGTLLLNNTATQINFNDLVQKYYGSPGLLQNGVYAFLTHGEQGQVIVSVLSQMDQVMGRLSDQNANIQFTTSVAEESSKYLVVIQPPYAITCFRLF